MKYVFARVTTPLETVGGSFGFTSHEITKKEALILIKKVDPSIHDLVSQDQQVVPCFIKVLGGLITIDIEYVNKKV